MSKITEDERKEIIQLFKAGVRPCKISLLVNHSKDSVIKELNKAGFSTSRSIIKFEQLKFIADEC